MIPMEAKVLLSAIYATGKKFSANEASFLLSINEHVNNDRLLTEKQANWLEDIYAKVTETECSK